MGRNCICTVENPQRNCICTVENPQLNCNCTVENPQQNCICTVENPQQNCICTVENLCLEDNNQCILLQMILIKITQQPLIYIIYKVLCDQLFSSREFSLYD